MQKIKFIENKPTRAELWNGTTLYYIDVKIGKQFVGQLAVVKSQLAALGIKVL